MPNREPDIYIYKMVADNGGAPCVAAGLLSLAICKPMIRKSAEKGSLIFGFGGKVYGERLLYIACVTQKWRLTKRKMQWSRLNRVNTNMELLKKFDDICQNDPRQDFFVSSTGAKARPESEHWRISTNEPKRFDCMMAFPK
jgi:hypothetical protein